MSDENYIARVDRLDWTGLECVTTDMCNESGDEPDERNCMLYRGAAGRSHEYSPPLLGYAWTLPGTHAPPPLLYPLSYHCLLSTQ